jgi:hypothetical protein
VTSYCRIVDCQAPTQGFICKPCCNEAQRAIAELQSYRYELSLLATRQTNVYRANGRPGVDDELAELDEEYAWRAARIPAHLRSRDGRIALPQTATMVHLPARDLLEHADNLIVTWARVLHEATGIPWPGFATVADVLVWLTDNAEAIRWHEAAAEAHHDLTDLHRRMQRAVDRAPSRVYAGPCGTRLDDGTGCDRPLYSSAPPHFDSEDDRTRWWREHPIVCDGYRPPFDRSDGWAPGDKGCGTEHDRGDRRAWMIAELEDRLLPLSLLQDTLPGLIGDLIQATPPKSVVAAWVRQGRLIARTVIDGVEFFRGGDLVTLMIAYRPHRYAPRPNRRGRMSA